MRSLFFLIVLLAVCDAWADPPSSKPNNAAPTGQIVANLGKREVILESGRYGLKYFPDECLAFVQTTPQVRLLMAADKTTFLLVGRDMKSLVDRGEVLRTFDLDRVQPPIVFRVGQPGEIYWGIGRGEIKIEGLPVFADQLGPFGSTTSDSERTMVQLETTKIMMVIISFLGAEGLDVALRRAAGALERYAAATGIETGVVA